MLATIRHKNITKIKLENKWPNLILHWNDFEQFDKRLTYIVTTSIILNPDGVSSNRHVFFGIFIDMLLALFNSLSFITLPSISVEQVTGKHIPYLRLSAFVDLFNLVAWISNIYVKYLKIFTMLLPSPVWSVAYVLYEKHWERLTHAIS